MVDVEGSILEAMDVLVREREIVVKGERRGAVVHEDSSLSSKAVEPHDVGGILVCSLLQRILVPGSIICINRKAVFQTASSLLSSLSRDCASTSL